MSDISDKFPQDSHLVIVSQLSQNKIHKFSIKFENKDLSDYVNLLNLRRISKVTITGKIVAEGKKIGCLMQKLVQVLLKGV